MPTGVPRNGKVVTYRSPRLAALLKAQPAGQPTLTGRGSIAHTEPVPDAYSVQCCDAHGSRVAGNSEVRIRVKTWPFKSYWVAGIGHGLSWCRQCRQYVIPVGEKLWFPESPELRPGMKHYLGTVDGNAMCGEGKSDKVQSIKNVYGLNITKG